MSLASRPPHYSFSGLKTWNTCGEQYRLEKIAKVPRKPAVWLLGGSAFHYAIERYEIERFGGNELSRDDLHDLFLADLRTRTEDTLLQEPDERQWRVAGFSKAKPDGENVRWWQDAGCAMIDDYLAYRERETGWKIWEMPDGSPAVEIDITARLSEEILIKGFIDSVRDYGDYGLGVVDLKTGSRKQDSTMQLGLYKVVMWETLGVEVPMGDYYSARKGACEQGLASLQVWTSEKFLRQFQSMDRAIKNGVFNAKPSSLCTKCEVREYCAIFGGDKADEFRNVGFPE